MLIDAKNDFKAHESQLRAYSDAQNNREDLELKYAQLFKDFRGMSTEYWRNSSSSSDQDRASLVEGYRRFKAMEEMVEKAKIEIAEKQHRAISLRNKFIKSAKAYSEVAGFPVSPISARRDNLDMLQAINDLEFKIKFLMANLRDPAKEIVNIIFSQSNIAEIEHAYIKREIGLDKKLSEEILEFISDIDLMTAMFTDEELNCFRKIVKYSSIIRQLKSRTTPIEG